MEEVGGMTHSPRLASRLGFVISGEIISVVGRAWTVSRRALMLSALMYSQVCSIEKLVFRPLSDVQQHPYGILSCGDLFLPLALTVREL